MTRKRILYILIFTILSVCSTQHIPSASDTPDGMVLIPAGEFEMGSHNQKANERPVIPSISMPSTWMLTRSQTHNTKFSSMQIPNGRKITSPKNITTVYTSDSGMATPIPKAKRTIRSFMSVGTQRWLTQNRQVNGYQQKQSGRKPPVVDSFRKHIHPVIPLMQPRQTSHGISAHQSPSDSTHPTVTAYTIWQEIFLSGVLMNTILISMQPPREKTHFQKENAKRLSTISKKCRRRNAYYVAAAGPITDCS